AIMEKSSQPSPETRRFAGYALAEGLVTAAKLHEALDLQKERPFLHLGEILCLMGAMDEQALSGALSRYSRDTRLGNVLLAKGVITMGQLAEVLELQLTDSRRLGELLVSRGYLRPDDLENALVEKTSIEANSKDLFAKCAELQYFREAQAAGRYPFFQPVQAGEGARSRVNDREVVMLAANSYLGMSTDPDVIAASIEATEAYGVGTSGSPFLNGTMDLHVALAKELAEFMGKEACVVYSTGFQTNLGGIAGLVGHGDVVLIDAFAHASIHDGCRLSFGEFKRFNHNNMLHLEQLLKQAGNRGKLIVIDGVYSMDGDLADLPAVVNLAKTYGAKILLDDAHGFGILGAKGRGTAEYFGLMDQVDLVMLTFSKSLGTIGGCIVGDESVIHYLKHRSRPFVFSASLPPGTVAATRAALRKIQAEPALRQRLANNMTFLRQGLVELGFTLGDTQTQIIPILLEDDAVALQMGTEMLAEGVMVATVVPPGVPEGEARLRVSVMASHSLEDLQFALDTFEKVGKRLGVLGKTEAIPKEGEAMFDCEIVETPETIQLVLTGELDTAAAQNLDVQLDALADNLGRDVTVDFSGLSYLNSTGLRSFLRLDKQLKALGRSLVLRGVNAEIYKLFYYCGLDSFFTFRDPDMSQLDPD
ncbi:MAG: aminotransferase class I/II-fold pyridoxal phosphate-dependent enzyme, partial [Cyanobacteria bacterium REEB65]|nr:aminotransferase class I/II-fold pyridoxal phosphate-dependent enzyme [Cyanobacteria bacterium REEB65]